MSNIYGFSPYSNVVSQMAAVVPTVPAAPVTTNEQTSVTVQWDLPHNGGSFVTKYDVELAAKDGTWHHELSYCNAQVSSSIITNRLCTIPMHVLQATPFEFELGDVIMARVSAENVIGSSEFSQASSHESSARIQTVPSAPSGLCTEGPQTSTSQIHILIDAVTGEASGNSPILSYHIQSDMGSAEAEWTDLKGFVTNDATLEWIETNLLISVEYKLRYRARNIFGWSDYSQVSSIVTMMVPSQVASAPTVTLEVTNVEITWSEPDARGSPITHYIVQIINSAGEFVESELYCSGVSTTSCMIPMSELVSQDGSF